MLVVVETSITRPNTTDEPLVVYDTPVLFRLNHGLKQVVQLVQEVVLLLIGRLPLKNQFPEGNGVEENLQS